MVRPARLERATFCFVVGVTRFLEFVNRASSVNSQHHLLRVAAAGKCWVSEASDIYFDLFLDIPVTNWSQEFDSDLLPKVLSGQSRVLGDHLPVWQMVKNDLRWIVHRCVSMVQNCWSMRVILADARY
jgi:hypothetical protein